MAVDFRGGGKLPGKKDVVTEPGEILLLDLNGNLVVRNEIEDALLIDEVMGVVEEADTPQADAAGGIRYGLDTIAPVSSKKGADKKKGAAKKTGNPRLDYSNP